MAVHNVNEPGCDRCEATLGVRENPGCPHGVPGLRTRVINDLLLQKVMDHVAYMDRNGPVHLGEAIARLDQGEWRLLELAGDDDDDPNRCKTSMCLAGWTVELNAINGQRTWALSADEYADVMASKGDYRITPRYEMDLVLADTLGAELPYAAVTSAFNYDTGEYEFDKPTTRANTAAHALLGMSDARALISLGHHEKLLDPLVTDEMAHSLVHLFEGANTVNDLRYCVTKITSVDAVLERAGLGVADLPRALAHEDVLTR